MNCQYFRVTMVVVFCWTTGRLMAEHMNDQQSTISYSGIFASPYAFYHLRPEYSKDCNEVRDQCSSDISSGVYLIKPDGYPEPFEVYCDKKDSEVWMVILRRTDGSVDFNRNWNDYKVGFGFLSHEGWIGNDKLSYLTNQKKYELLINLTNSNGTSCTIAYDVFRISDEYDEYKLTNIGAYSGNADKCFPIDQGNCSCQRSCQDPYKCQNICDEENTWVCPKGFYMKGKVCVHPEECGCFDSGYGIIIAEGAFLSNHACTRRTVCNNGQLRSDDSYTCSPEAVCEERDNVLRCYCNATYIGDGVTCVIATDCLDIYKAGFAENGIYTIRPSNWSGSPFQVYCNMTDGGGWTTFQRRVDGTVDFYRNWTSYKEGFGRVDHEFWLGNDKLYYLTNQKNYTIRIDLVDNRNRPYYANYDLFRITDEDDLYRLSELGAYTGNADDGGHGRSDLGYPFSHHRSYPFSTYDRDNDAHSGYNCAETYHGAWWYMRCYKSNLNGDYNATSYYPSIRWYNLPGNDYYLKYTEMKVRPLETT